MQSYIDSMETLVNILIFAYRLYILDALTLNQNPTQSLLNKDKISIVLSKLNNTYR